MRDYGKVYSTFWSSDTTGGMSDDAKLLALYLVTCSHSTIAGVFRLPDGYISEDLGWSSERVRQGFGELLSKGFANRCETTKWVWVCKHLEWNKPENPNQRKSAAKIAMSIPPGCSWKQAFMRDCGEVLALPKPENPNPRGTLSKGFLNQEQEQEQEQEDSFDLLAESQQAQPTSGIRIPLNDGSEYTVPPADIDEWKLAYQAVDVESELRQMRTWALANPTRRKTVRGVSAFIVKWLAKAQDNPGAARSFGTQSAGGGMSQETYV